MPEHGRFDVIGRTRDDAAGEAFDKAARMLGLGYPGGPALDRLARTGDARRQPLPKPSLPGLEYSFSGLKTALLYRLRDLGDAAGPQEKADLAAAFEHSVVESLLEKLDDALSREPVAEVVVAGGVAANTLLRRRATQVVGGRARLTMPPLELCTDNAAMIAAVGVLASPRSGEVGSRLRLPGGGLPQSIAIDPSLGWG
jgi:N6-L-threonylcarbamoyladenine synthase